MKIGKRIKELRSKMNLSLRVIAEKSGVSKTTIHELENGIVTNPTLETIEKIANVLNISIAQLMEENVETLKGDGAMFQTIDEETIKELAQQVTKILGTRELSFKEVRLVLQKVWEMIERSPIVIHDPRNEEWDVLR